MSTRLIFTAAAMPADEARALLTVICSQASSTTMERTRRRLQKRFKSALVRVIDFAKHETLRKAHRYLHSHRPLMGADATDHYDANKIAFDMEQLRQDLRAMIQMQAETSLSIATSDTLKQVGYGETYKLPAQDVLDFIARRQNLLTDVPNEIFDQIKAEISAGLTQGESIADLSARITAAFDQIEGDRAEMIAETETAAAYSYASDKAARAAGIQYKKWQHGGSKVPRPDHLAIDGMVVPMDEPFPVGSPPLMYPHDPEGAPEDVINCSCISVPATAEEYQG